MSGCLVLATGLTGMVPSWQGERDRLYEYALDLGARSRSEKIAARELAVLRGLPVEQLLSNGRVLTLEKFVRGRPYYFISHNLGALHSIGAERLHPGGDLNLDLSGSGLVLGLWDSGKPLVNHQEFGNRISVLDGAPVISDHATHLAGTMIGAGIDPVAQGIAPAAGLLSYDWGDNLAETAAAAAGGQISLSTHPYGLVTGWQANYLGDLWAWFGDPVIHSQEDWQFGFYLDESAAWDSIAWAAPFHLIVASAGNDRQDKGPDPGATYILFEDGYPAYSNVSRPPDGDFDSLPGGLGVAKNVLTVGAVEKLPTGYTQPMDVQMTAFSSWGPTDDGRIKPDLVAPGKGLYSASSRGTEAYGTRAGTSQAAAVAGGTLALLQEYYARTHNGILPRSATLRALAIHTALEAGSAPGPDYAFGWGLLNPAGAVQVIAEDAEKGGAIRERVLFEGQTFVVTVVVSGQESLKATLAWTDPPGIVPGPSLDPAAPGLVNDLDLRITTEGCEWEPWRLDGNSPAQAATRGDNQRDNVEQSEVQNPGMGTYRITVTHKGQLLAASQAFSLIITGGTVLPPPTALVWEGNDVADDYSGRFIRDTLTNMGLAGVSYTTDFPGMLDGYDAVFLSFGNYGASTGKTPFSSEMAGVVQAYLEGGGALYLEGGDALGGTAFDQGENSVLHGLLGLSSVIDGPAIHTPAPLVGAPGSAAEGMVFGGTSQSETTYIDHYVSQESTPALEEPGYGTVAVQNRGAHGQRTFVTSYTLAALVDGSTPSHRALLLGNIMEFFTTNQPAPPVASDDYYTVSEDSDLTMPVLDNDRDPNEDPLLLTLLS
ncbi:S8 family serine peptidase, partial [Candidatus Neomarinimicrobiota bacterium]